MGQWWKAFVVCGLLTVAAVPRAQAELKGDWRTCVDQSDPVAGYAACSRLIASGRLGAALPRGYMMRAIHASKRNDYDAAEADFSEAIRLAPTANHYTDRGLIYILKGNYARAIMDFDQSIRLKPTDANAYYMRALALGRNGEFVPAIAGFDDAIRLNPSCTICYVKRAIAYEKIGDTARAKESFQAALLAPGKSQSSEDAEARSTAQARLAQWTLAPANAQQIATIPPPVSVAALPPPPAPPVQKAATVPAGRRVALVIGNSEYRSVPSLPNPRRDAATIADSLRSVGFQKVILANDLTRDRLVDALKAFASEADGADWAMVYFAGHGIEVGGLNYILPIDARLATDRDVQFEAVALEQVMAATDGAKKLHLVMLDACRDNPFANEMKRTVASRSLGRGLAQIEPDAGTLVVFSAKHGQVAFDGDGRNSPFVSAFVKRMATPHIEIRKLFDLVRDDVMAATNRRQQPYSYGSVPGSEDFYFVTAMEVQAR